MTFSTKRLADVTADDIRGFVGTEPPECDSLELKQSLPARDGDDPWIRGENHISDRARNELIEEICAFANAHGGMLLLGVTESSDHPKRAAGLAPVPRCSDLAVRLRLQIRDCIEPQLASVEVEGIITEPDGAGVIAVRVPESARAPHRSSVSRECYLRRADRSEKMTMREIQDLTLTRAMTGQTIASTLEARGQAFRLENDQRGCNLTAMRATGLPATSISVDRVHGRADLKPSFETFRGHISGSAVQFSFPHPGYQDRPILRGTRFYTDDRTIGIAAEVHNDGMVEYRWRWAPDVVEDSGLSQQWVVATAMNLMLSCDRFRRVAGAPSQEYGIVFEFYRIGGDLRLDRWENSFRVHPAAIVRPNPIVLPALSLGDREEIPALIGILYRDLNNAAGFDIGEHILVPELPALAV